MRVNLILLLVYAWYLSTCNGICDKDGSGSKYNAWLTIADESNGVENIYSKWLIEANRDVKYFIGTFWARLVDYIGTEVADLSRVSGRLQKIADARDNLQRACEDWGSHKTIWPYSCFSKEFNCKFYEAVKACYDAGNVGEEQQKKSSLIGPDTTARSDAIDKLFVSELLNYIPLKFVEEAFYSSGFVKETYIKLYLVHKQPGIFPENSVSKWYNWAAVKSIVTEKCSSMAGKAVAEQYYCKAKDIMTFFESCLNLGEPEICLLDSRFMHYWDTGSKLDYWRIKSAVDEDLATAIVNRFFLKLNAKLKSDDFSALQKLIMTYKPYLTVSNERCFQGWPRRFTCDNDKCEAIWTYRLDCTLKLISKAVLKYADLRLAGKPKTDQAVIDSKYAIQVWQTYPIIAEYGTTTEKAPLLELHKRINQLFKLFDLQALATLTENFPPSRYTEAYVVGKKCQPPSDKYTYFCILEPTINTIQDIAEKVRQPNKAVILLNPEVNYRELLKQLQLQDTSNKILQQTENYFNSIISSITQNFGYLANYFSALATFDAKKSQADISFIQGRLNKFDSMVTQLSQRAANSMRVIMICAFTATAAELAQRVTEFAFQVAAACNPITWLSGGNVDDIMAALDNMVQAGVALAQVGSITADAIPDLGRRAAELQKNFGKNKDHLKMTKKVIDDLVAKSDQAVDSSTKFLSLYDSYSPAVLRSDITSYGEKFSAVVVGLCEAVFKGTSAASGLVEIGLASSGDCIKVSSQIIELVTVYEEMYDYQFELMGSLVEVSRAFLASKKAKDMTKVYTDPPSDLSLFLKENSVLTFAISSYHTWSVVNEYCNLLAYRNGGRMATICSTAISNPSFRNFAEVIAYEPSQVCNTNNEITQYVTIPTKPKDKDDTAYINLDRLYKKETVSFSIPDHQWLVNHKWIHSGDITKAIYVKRFEIFLPPMTDSTHHLIEVQVSPDMANKLDPTSNTKYFLPLLGMTTRYQENVASCYNEKFIINPYAICNQNDAPKLCMTSNGLLTGETRPTIFNKWVVNLNALPLHQKNPVPVTDFKLQGAVTICLINRSSKKREINRVVKRRVEYRRNVQHCCSSNQFWDGSTCTTCPNGSVQKLAGYYCE